MGLDFTQGGMTNDCWSVCLHPYMLGGEHFFGFLHCRCSCFSDQMVMFSQTLYLKRNRKNDEGWGKIKALKNAMFMKLYPIIWAS